MANRRLGLNEQSAYGSVNKVPTKYLDYINFSAPPSPNKDLPVTSAYRMKRFSVQGPYGGSYTIENVLAPDNIGHLLKWTTGSVDSGVADNTVYLHNFTMAQELNSFTIEDCRGLTAVESNFLSGCLVKTLTLEAPARETCRYTVEGNYRTEELDTLTPMGTLPSLRPFIFAGGAVNLAGSPLANVEAFTFNWTNTIPDDSHGTGSQFREVIDIEGCEITGTVDLKFLNWAIRKRLYGGSGTATSPQTEDLTQALILDFVGSSTGEGVVTSYELKVTLPAVTLTANEADSSGRDRLTQSFEWEALYNAGNKIELWNKVTSYA